MPSAESRPGEENAATWSTNDPPTAAIRNGFRHHPASDVHRLARTT
jgi:hypothetical protein